MEWRRRPLAAGMVLWHLMSLDGPTVAALWNWFLARGSGIRLPGTEVAAMFLAVWILYAADRLLDARLLDTPSSGAGSLREFEARHLFHRRHRTGFRAGIAVASVGLAAIVPGLSPGELRLYLVLGGVLAGYFVLVHLRSGGRPGAADRVPKELAVGFFFSAAAFLPTVSREPLPRVDLLPEAALFALLCSLNCVFIHAWEHPQRAPGSGPQVHPATHTATRLALRWRTSVAVGVIVAGVCLAMANWWISSPIPLACALAAALLLGLNAVRARLNAVTLRAAADLCLLTPVLLLPLLRG